MNKYPIQIWDQIISFLPFKTALDLDYIRSQLSCEMMNDESVHLSTKIDLSVPVTDNNNHIYDDSNNSNSKLLEEKDDLMERLDLLENIQRHEEKSGICNFDSNT